MRKAIFMILVVLFIQSWARAEVIQKDPTATEVINAMGAQAGYFYGIRATHGYSYLSTKLAILGPEAWHLTLDGGLISTSGAAVTVNYDLMAGLSLNKVPVLGFFDAAKVGAGVMITNITAFSDGSQVNGADNRLDVGPCILFSKKFGPQAGK